MRISKRLPVTFEGDCTHTHTYTHTFFSTSVPLNEELFKESKHLGNGGTVIDFAAFNWASVSLCTVYTVKGK